MTPGLPFPFDGRQREAEILTDDGVMPMFLATPGTGGPWPGVILYMDAVGVREELRDMARFIAAEGYACLMPNLYYRDGGPSFDPHEPFRQRDLFMPLAAGLTRDRILADTAATLAFARAAPEVAPGPMGCVGYCMGGRFVVWAAAAFADDFAAGASLFSPGLVSDRPDSPHLALERVRAELFFGFGAEDRFIPPLEIARLRDALDAAGTRHFIEIYDGAEHAFIFPQRGCHQREATEKAWRATLAVLSRGLQRAGPRDDQTVTHPA